MRNKEKMYNIIDEIIKNARYYTSISMASKKKETIVFANSQIIRSLFSEDVIVTINVMDGKKQAKISLNILESEALVNALRRVEANLELVDEGELLFPEIYWPKEIIHEEDKLPRVEFDAATRANLIKAGIKLLEEKFTAAGSISIEEDVEAFGNNRGIKRYKYIKMLRTTVLITHEDGSSGYAQCISENPSELDTIDAFKIAFNKAKAGINPISLEPGEYTVILEPLAVGNLINNMNYSGFSARSVSNGTSFLTGKIGKKIFGHNITIIDDPKEANTISLYFDEGGNPIQPLTIIKRGVPKELAYDERSAIKENRETTGHSFSNGFGGIPQNIVMENGPQSLDEIIKASKKAILVTRFHYMNVVDSRKAVFTGITRDGTYLIENGKIKCGVKNMRFTESMLDALNQVDAISFERKKVAGDIGISYLPAIRIKKFHFTGKTE